MFLTASSGRRSIWRPTFWPRTSPRLRWVSTIAPIIATSRIRPAISNGNRKRRVEQLADRLDVGLRRRGAAWARRRRHRPRLPRRHRDDRSRPAAPARRSRPNGRLRVKPGAQRGEIDVEHHDDEQEQHRDRADVDDHQQHRDELGAEDQHQPGRVEEGEDQPQHAVHRVAREDHRAPPRRWSASRTGKRRGW